MPDHKSCTRCRQSLPIDSFEEVKPGVHRSMCRQCRCSTNRENKSAGFLPYLKLVISSLRSSRRNTHEFLIDAEYLAELWEKQNGRCAVSGVVLTHHNDGSGRKEFNASIDRIDSTQGYIPGNVQLVAYRVNVLKHSLSTDMLYWWVKTIYQHSCD